MLERASGAWLRLVRCALMGACKSSRAARGRTAFNTLPLNERWQNCSGFHLVFMHRKRGCGCKRRRNFFPPLLDDLKTTCRGLLMQFSTVLFTSCYQNPVSSVCLCVGFFGCFFFLGGGGGGGLGLLWFFYNLKTWLSFIPPFS